LRSLFGLARKSWMARRMRVSSKRAPQRRSRAPAREIGLDDRQQQFLQHELQPLGGEEAVVQHLDREGLGELLDAGRDGLARLREGPRVLGGEDRREALAQPGAGGVQHQDPRGIERDVDLARIEEHHVGAALLQHDGGISLGLHRLLGAQLHQHEPPEPAFE
jgi:hypothetical protein